MPEGDTIHRIAAGLRPYLTNRIVRAARSPRADVRRVVGSTVTAVNTNGKNLLIRFSNDLTVRTHLRMNGTWHRYRPGEPWRGAASRAMLVLEVDGAVAVCFDAPVVELFETRAEAIHPGLARLGPDLAGDAFDAPGALERLRDPARQAITIGEALLDQRVMAGVGNVFRSEILYLERVDPFATVGDLDEQTQAGLVATAHRLLRANLRRQRGPVRSTTGGAPEAAGEPLWVYRRTGRPCRRCGASIRAASLGRDLPRTVWWCPRCQARAT